MAPPLHPRFCVQSCSKPITYCMGLEHFGETKVHTHVGREPSGCNFNERVLNRDGIPQPPWIALRSVLLLTLTFIDSKRLLY